MENNKITVGEIVRDFFGLLNVLQKNQQLNIRQLIGNNDRKVESSKSELENVFDRFESM